MVNVFSPTIFFIVFREALEAGIVIAVLLAFLKKGIGSSAEDPKIYKNLKIQVWLGAGLGLLICGIIGGTFIGLFYKFGKDLWSKSEDLWEGIFCLIATILISFMGLTMLRINKMKEKWRVKLAKSLLDNEESKGKKKGFGQFTTKYAMFILPFVTTLREGMECVVFVGGVGLDTPASAFPIPVICGLIAGIAIGWLLYYGGSNSSMKLFLIFSTAVLYLISAGLLSRGVWFFENYVYSQKTGGDAAETGSGNGSYDLSNSVWHVNCCNPLIDNGWDVFNALLGWQNSATYGSVISYNLYWLVLILIIGAMTYQEKKGHLPFLKNSNFKGINLKPWKKRDNMTDKDKRELLRRIEGGRNKSGLSASNSNSETEGHELRKIPSSRVCAIEADTPHVSQ